MCDLDPDRGFPPIAETSTATVSALFFWLQKEWNRGMIRPVVGSGDLSRFVPGTLMRHVQDFAKDKFAVSPDLFDTYSRKAAPPKPGSGQESRIAKDFYVAAATEIWSAHPDFPTAALADLLVPLPKLMENLLGEHIFAPRGREAIRRIIRSKGPGKAGRPKKGSLPLIDMGALTRELAEKLVTKTGLIQLHSAPI